MPACHRLEKGASASAIAPAHSSPFLCPPSPTMSSCIPRFSYHSHTIQGELCRTLCLSYSGRSPDASSEALVRDSEQRAHTGYGISQAAQEEVLPGPLSALCEAPA